ncbi:MAG: hypothetical protein PHU85_19895, partial [Phycisphaerae bacterium]|nr:hypothetical protein [Phycisphaerae bacterium]
TRPKPLPVGSGTPRSDIAKVVITSEPTASDNDKDGVPDGLKVECYLFPPSDKSVPSSGKGAFRFEVFNAEQPAEERVPFQQVNVNFEQGRRYAHVNRYGLIVYSFRVPLPQIPAGVRQAYVRARFFPEDNQPEAEPGGTSATVTSTAQPPRATLPPPASMPSSSGGPETRIITIKPRTTQK